MQVLTSGELATARGGDIGLLVVHGAGNVDRNKLRCALTIGGDIARQALAHLVHGKCNSSKASEPSTIGSASAAAAPEASMMQVSLVEVSESTVTLLKVCLTVESSRA